MKFRDFKEAAGVGIITKQNATKDVPVGGEYMNVKKLGLGKGKPKELHKKARKNSTPNKMFNLGMAESEKNIKYTKPNLDHEWDEATRYQEFKKIGKNKWIDLVSKGKVVEYNTKTVQKISNTDAVNVKDFDNLDKNKQQRALKQLQKGSIELPIVASYSDGHLELIGGNTRLTAVMKATGKGKVWQFNVPDKVATLAESTDKTNLYELISALGHLARTVAPKVLPKVNPSSIGATGAGAVAGNQIGKAVDKAISKKSSTKNTSPAAGPTILPKIVKPEPRDRSSYKSHTKVKPLKIGEVSAKDLSKDSEVYVDMDGVLADFFGAWKRLVGKDWREIKDLDGALQKIRDKDDFWLNIPLTPNAMNLLGLVKQLKGSYNILSAPLPNDPKSEPHKRQWIEKNLSAFPPRKVIITSNKSVHATQPDGTPNILIDDFGKNIAKWEAAGGVGFKHKDHKFERTVKNLKQHMSEAKMSKSSIKKIRKTVDKIDDKPKAKKSISKWAKGKFDDPKAAMFAIATNMRKRKEGKPIDPPGRESYARSELPQIRKKHLVNFPHAIENISVSKIKPMQKERLKENYNKQLKNILVGKYNPIVVDIDYKIINGHHRYDIINMLQMESISVARLPFTLEQIIHKMENFADGKKKGKSRPGRVKRSGASCKGSVTSLRSKAKKASGERAKMYHWCANMKSGKKKSESLYTQDEFFKILVESTPQQLEEGIKDTLKKLPKNLLGKVTPLIKKIPKTAKNLTLMAVLLGTMANAVAAGDMQKVNTPLDKLNNMATMSTTMDTGTDVGPGHTMPDNIKVLKMPTPPEAPNSNTPDGTSDNGTSIKTTKDGNRTVSSGAGTYTFSPDGKLLKYETPKIKGYSQTHDLVKKTVTVNANTPVTMTKDFGNLSKADRDTLKKNDPNFDKTTTVIDQKATYDMSGKLISKDHTGVKSGGVSVGIGGDGSKSVKYDAGGGKVYKVNTNDMPAAKKTLAQFQKDINKAKAKSAPFQNKTT